MSDPVPDSDRGEAPCSVRDCRREVEDISEGVYLPGRLVRVGKVRWKEGEATLLGHLVYGGKAPGYCQARYVASCAPRLALS